MSNYEHIPIKAWALEDRPREKMLHRGMDALTDAELLALILATGTKDQSAIDLARSILREMGGLHRLARSSVSELIKIKGIGPAKAITLMAAFEISRRKHLTEEEEVKVKGAESVAKYLGPKLEDLEQEVFYVLFLNRNNVVKSEKLFFRGGISATVIDPKPVYKEALNMLASAIVMVHNHPSGNLTPSKADMDITKKMVDAGKMVDIQVLDHVIITRKGYYSFADQGML